MTVSIQLTNFRGVVQETHVVEVPRLCDAYTGAERLARLHSASTGRTLFAGNVEVLA